MADYSKEFNEVVSEIKSLGYKVYTDSTLDAPTWGYLRDGDRFLYFQVEVQGLRFAVECRPDWATGSGLFLKKDNMRTDEGLSKSYIENALDIKYGVPYRSWNSFVQELSEMGTNLKEI